MRRNLLLGAVVVLAFFGLVEGALRLSGKIPTDALRSPDAATLDRIAGLFQPGQELIDRIRPDLPYHIRINSEGFRGEEVDLSIRPAGRRILCVGDSYTFGHHVDDAEAFPARLERILDGEGRDDQVINAGANGFTIVDELEYLRLKGMNLRPDLVILSFSQNDIMDLTRPRPMIDVMREHAELKGRFLLGPALKFLQHTALFNGMQRLAASLRVRQRRGAPAGAGADLDALWSRYRRHLAQVAQLVGEHGARLLLVVWPSAEQAAGAADLEPQRRLARDCSELGLDMLDLTPTLRSAINRGEHPYLVPLDGHPSAEGHALAAEAIARRLAGGDRSGTSPAERP